MGLAQGKKGWQEERADQGKASRQDQRQEWGADGKGDH
jgi:hypothetical protein